jgi:hypothetical protein
MINQVFNQWSIFSKAFVVFLFFMFEFDIKLYNTYIVGKYEGQLSN